MNREPAAIVSAITGLATAIVVLVVAFGLPLTVDQQAAILTVVGAVAPIVAGLVIRSQVFATKTVADILTARQNPSDD